MIIISLRLYSKKWFIYRKDSSINEELERLRLSATASLLSFDDVVIASVSANYGLGNPTEYKAMVQKVEVGFEYSQKQFY